MGAFVHQNQRLAAQTEPVTELGPAEPLAERIPRESLHQKAEAHLLAKAQRRDQAALTTLVERYQSDIYAYLVARLLDPTDAADLCQEVFLRCCSGKVGSLRGVSLRIWLIGVARNVLREHLRRVGRRKEVAWTELCLDLETYIPEPDPLYEDQIDRLPQCLEELGPSARQALDLHYRDSQKITSIAGKLRRSEGAVRLLMHRARQAVRRCLERKASDSKFVPSAPR